MGKPRWISLALLVVLTAAAPLTQARNAGTDDGRRFTKMAAGRGYGISLDRDPSRLPAFAPASTTYLASFTFDSLNAACTDEGFLSIDFSAQVGEFFHIADGTELDGGTFGHLLALEGQQSLWCGAYDTDYPTRPPNMLCNYAELPGYGNHWNQAWCTKECISVTTGVAVTARMTWHSEPGYDGVTVEVDSCTGGTPNHVWFSADTVKSAGGHFDGLAVDSLHTHSIPDSMHNGALRIRFRFQADRAWSDSDGLWDSDGAIIIDSLSVSDASGIVLAVEDFEDEAAGPTSHEADDWASCVPPGYGDYGAMWHGADQLQLDPCVRNLSCLWAFVDTSAGAFDYSCGGYPGVPTTPYYDPPYSFLDNQILSPPIQYAGVGSGNTSYMIFDYYADLPLAADVFVYWHVRAEVGGCFGGYQDNGVVHFSNTPIWVKDATRDLSPYLPPGTERIQVSVGAIDLCPFWCTTGVGRCHSNAPLIDNIDVIRIESAGPVWTVDARTLFQDTFPDDGTLTGTARLDIAQDRNQFTNPVYRPGDSVSVHVTDPEHALAVDAEGWAKVCMYVSVRPPDPAKAGHAITQDPVYNPVLTAVVIDGYPWNQIRMDSTFYLSATRQIPLLGLFRADLNDNLFTPGDTIAYFFSAQSDDASGTTTYWSEFTGAVYDMATAAAAPIEVQVLPSDSTVDILYIDAWDGRGAQPYFDTAFRMLGIAEGVDRYDYRVATSDQGNGPGNLVKDVFAQIVPVYKNIIVCTGEIESHGLDDKTQKSDDAYIIHTFLDQTTRGGGFYWSGDFAGTQLYDPGALANMVKLQSYIRCSAVSPDQFDLGLGRRPRIVGTPGSMFDHALGPDTLLAEGSCPAARRFDVLTNVPGTSTIEAEYHGNGFTAGAIIAQRTENAVGDTVGAVLSGVSYHNLRSAPNHHGLPDRVHHLADILAWLDNPVPSPTGAPLPQYANSLRQNYPNPFNPQTTIAFSLRERAHVTLRVYNVAGQLVRTLVDGVRNAGAYDDVTWGGDNNAGESVSSGVYFYRLVTRDFKQTKKMVLLK